MFGFKKRGTVAQEAATREVTLTDGNTYTVVRQVDCLGDSCPRPQLMTKKTIGQVQPGDVIEIMVDNPSSMEALPPMCDEIDSTHLDTIKAERCWQVYIRKD